MRWLATIAPGTVSRRDEARARRRARARLATILLGAVLLQGCATDWGPGYHLPQGDPERGRAAFAALSCGGCHALAGEPQTDAQALWTLGGQTVRVKTYGDLVTSIVNPSHRIARGYGGPLVLSPDERDEESPMAYARINEVMTVQQLVDIVAFLQDEYELVPPPIRPVWEQYPTDHDRSRAWPPPRP